MSDTRGIGAARRWVKAEFDRISETCGGCLDVSCSEADRAERRDAGVARVGAVSSLGGRDRGRRAAQHDTEVDRDRSGRRAESCRLQVYWRLTDQPQWQWSEFTTNTEHTLENVVIDNYIFGVASVAEGGFESPVVFPGPIGAFAPAARSGPDE